MKVFHSPQHVLHAPQWYVADGTVRPCPDSPRRVEGILAALRQAGGFEMAIADVDPWPALRAIHTADYLEYLQTIHARWSAQFGAGVDVIPDTFMRRAGMKRPAQPFAQAGYYCFDMAAPITGGTFVAALEGARCAVAAAQAVLAGERAAYALCRPPGHHAGPDYCGGFCYLNNAAAAAQHLVMGGKARVAVLDIDYHHGNGTQDIFYARKDVLFVSIHANPDTQYPYFWGHADETGDRAGAGFNVNLPLPRSNGQARWFRALRRAEARICRFQPDAMVISFGADTHEADPVGDFKLTLDSFSRIGGSLAGAFGVPIVIAQEGGYALEAVGPCVNAFLRPFNG